jgi:hypothetical protein
LLGSVGARTIILDSYGAEAACWTCHLPPLVSGCADVKLCAVPEKKNSCSA